MRSLRPGSWKCTLHGLEEADSPSSTLALERAMRIPFLPVQPATG